MVDASKSKWCTQLDSDNDIINELLTWKQDGKAIGANLRGRKSTRTKTYKQQRGVSSWKREEPALGNEEEDWGASLDCHRMKRRPSSTFPRMI